jgi:hypothetical protein
MPLNEAAVKTMKAIVDIKPRMVVVDSNGYGQGLCDLLNSGVNVDGRGFVKAGDVLEEELFPLVPTNSINREMVDNLKLLLDTNKILFPERRLQLAEGEHANNAYHEVNHLVNEMIYVMKIPGGHGMRYDSKKRKDRWSALNMAVYGFFMLNYNIFNPNATDSATDESWGWV